ncbi:RICIN domain-containing protein [Streptomyces huiliensis]|uniref:RICIN domain-containing protein n=1 Tax=Streptomyces huiliensis TaxID=2876027 RepID=UPI001CBEBD1E|nr:RICIN domain-containing protein [Streptomyces huiliensis]MBZ4320152.1 RICIN domain-containing protein [Streptomyces huiliensis]
MSIPAQAKIIAKHSDKALDVSGASKESGATVDQWDWSDVDQQRFRFEPVGDGYYKIVAKHSGKILEVAGGPGNTANDALIKQADDTGSANQHFRLDPLTGGLW